jgi:predicted metal-dependent HD superfamily phosphohydrolase
MIREQITERWHQLAGQYCADTPLINDLLNELLRKYSGRQRHYHNLSHIAALLSMSDAFAAELHHKDTVDFSIFYHDIIYNTLRSDNEARSAAHANQCLRMIMIPPDTCEAVEIFINATKTHTISCEVFRSDLEYFLDFDMSILGADEPAYREYVKQVRREYAFYPDALFRKGRRQFLQSALQSAHIFHTAHFRASHEAQARANMQRELEGY